MDSILRRYDALALGEAEFEDRRFEDAIEPFENARAAFEEAGTIVEESGAPPALSSHFEVLSCQADRLESAAQYFIESASAAADDDLVSADQYRQEGEEFVEAAGAD